MIPGGLVHIHPPSGVAPGPKGASLGPGDLGLGMRVPTVPIWILGRGPTGMAATWGPDDKIPPPCHSLIMPFLSVVLLVIGISFMMESIA